MYYTFNPLDSKIAAALVFNGGRIETLVAIGLWRLGCKGLLDHVDLLFEFTMAIVERVRVVL